MNQAGATTRGFSLLELLIVMVVLGVLSAVAVPRFTLANQRFGLEMASQQLSRDIAFAQDHARAQSTAFELLISDATDTVSLRGPASSASPTVVFSTLYGASPFGVDLSERPGQPLVPSVEISGHGDLDAHLIVRMSRNGLRLDMVAMAPSGLVTTTSMTRAAP